MYIRNAELRNAGFTLNLDPLELNLGNSEVPLYDKSDDFLSNRVIVRRTVVLPPGRECLI